MQTLLLTWNGVLSGFAARWRLLLAFAAGSYLAIAIVSNQSIMAFYITHAPLFDPASAYYRLLIWSYGIASIGEHPLFGIGHNGYARLEWMVESIDMFWIIHAI